MFIVDIAAMSRLRLEVSFPRSMIIGLMPCSNSLSAANKPAGPEPTMITDLPESARRQTGSADCSACETDSALSLMYTLRRKNIFICLWRASIDFFITVNSILSSREILHSFFSKISVRIFFMIIDLLFSSSGFMLIESSVIMR